MKRKFLASLLLSLMFFNISSIKTFAIPNLEGLSNEEKIQIIDNNISESIEKINDFEGEITNNEFKIKEKQEELFYLQKEYQLQKKNVGYTNTGFLRTNSTLNQNEDLKMLELLLKSESISDFFQRIELNKTMKFKQSKETKLITIQEEFLIKLQESLNFEKKKLETDKDQLIEDNEQLTELKKKVQEEIEKSPKLIINTDNVPPEIVSAVSDREKSIIETSFKYLNIPYVWGGTTPSGFDCSGFVQYVFREHGINIPRVSQAQQPFGKQIMIEDTKPGDLLFFGYPAHHVALYIGNGQYIHAPRTGDVIKIENVNWNKISSVSRVIE